MFVSLSLLKWWLGLGSLSHNISSNILFLEWFSLIEHDLILAPPMIFWVVLNLLDTYALILFVS